FLVMMAFYLFMPVFTTWFCIIFIEWQRKVYEKIHNEIKPIEQNTSALGKFFIGLRKTVETVMVSPKITDQNLITLNRYSDKIQDIFSQLSDGIFKYALGVNMLVFLAASTFCTSRMLADAQYIYYIFPLAVAAGHICLLCARCCDLMEEHGNVLGELKEVLHKYEEQEQEAKKSDRKDKSRKHLINSLHKLRENLHDSPPEVVILGSFVVDYGMLSTIIGFILSYALVINELFDDSTPVCNFGDDTTAAPITTDNSASTLTTLASTAATAIISTITEEAFTTINSTDPGTISPDGNTLSDGAIAGIVIGSLVGVALVVGSIAFCYIKKKLCFSKLPTSP
ncbi:unnamed protein product, partial [Meganyctiphanes norvegica]